MHRHLLAFGLIVAACSAACASAPSRPDGGVPVGDYGFLAASLDHQLEQATKGPVVGMSAAVMVDGKVVWQGAAGMADEAAGREATPDTLYEIGSVSKLFTYAAVMQLVEAGKVDLDAPLNRHLPAFSLKPPLVGGDGWSVDQITVRSAMTHESGIPSDVFHRMFSKDPIPYTEYAGLMADTHAAAPPWRSWSYSNVAVTLLGHMVHEVSGVPFPEYIRKHVYAPLAMTRSDFSPEDGLAAEVSRSYMEGEEKEWLPVGQKPAGSMVSSAPQLLKFGQAMMSGGAVPGGRVLTAESVKAHFTRQNADVALDTDLKMGLGWFLDDMPGVGRTVRHSGATMYHRAFFVLCPVRKIAVAVLANSEEADVKSVANEALRLATEAQTGEAPTEPTLADEVGPHARPVGDPRAHAGLWMTPAGLMRMAARGDQLDVTGGPIGFRLDPTGRGTWAGAIVLGDLIPIRMGRLQESEVRFLRIGQDRIVVFEHSDSGRMMVGTKVKAWPIPLGWSRRLGDWDIEGGADWVMERVVLERKHGVLVATLHSSLIPFPVSLALRPIDGRRAVIDGIGRSRGDAVIVERSAGVEKMKLLGYTLTRAVP